MTPFSPTTILHCPPIPDLHVQYIHVDPVPLRSLRPSTHICAPCCSPRCSLPQHNKPIYLNASFHLSTDALLGDRDLSPKLDSSPGSAVAGTNRYLLSGTIPDELFGIAPGVGIRWLKILSLQKHSFSGTTPRQLHQMTRLSQL